MFGFWLPVAKTDDAIERHEGRLPGGIPHIDTLACAGHALGSGKSRPRFAVKRGGAFYLYTIPLWRLLGDGWFW